MKRSRPSDGPRHPLQLRKVIVPESTEEWIRVQQEDAYYEDDWFQESSNQVQRPLPSVQILTSLIAPPGGASTSTPALFDPLQAPIFQKFYQSIGVQVPTSKDSVEASEDNNNDNIQHDIDNPSMSTLTKGQHKRYLQLTSSQRTERRNHHERRELQSLTSLVHAEQAKFRECLLQFWRQHQERFRIGLQSEHAAYSFCRWASNHQKEINQQWINDRALPMKYGKCLQILSFPSQYTSKLLDVDALHFQVIHEEETTVQSDFELPSIGTRIQAPSSATKIINWLPDDTVAMELAAGHNASIVTTKETLESMLQLPRDSHARWMFFAKTTQKQKGSITILDRPIAQPMLPRQCLELGIQEGMIQQCNNHVDANKHVYTLWTLPATTVATRRQPIRVLVRSTVRMIKGNIPMVVRPHVEYFPERGTIEEASLYEKSCWILDQLLFQHKVQTHMVRVDSQTCQVLELEETSVAHALASAASKASNPMIHWQTVIQIFQSLPSVGLEEYLLCLPGHDVRSATPSASIHAPGEGVVNLENVTVQAETVLLNPDALLHCSCDWKWTDRERIPYTFPLSKTSKQKE